MIDTEKILLVSDECETCNSLTEWAGSKPYPFEIARGAREALQVIGNGSVAVVAIDIRIPREEGMGLGTWLDEVSDQTAVVAISGKSSRKTMERILRHRLYDFVIKPAAAHEIGQRVEQALSERRARRETARRQLSGSSPEQSVWPLPERTHTSNGEPPKSLREVEREHILATLRKNEWNLGRTSDTLGIHRTSLRSKMKRYGLT